MKAVENYRYRVATGFLSTAFLLSELTKAGRSDIAYKLLENEEKPGWLAEIKAGATTIWESWEGDASLNHYSPGSVCEWLFSTVAGIRPDGERHFKLTPVPGGTLTHAQAHHDSLYGRVESGWKRESGRIVFHFRVPCNTTAEILLPNGERHEAGAGPYRFEMESETGRA